MFCINFSEGLACLPTISETFNTMALFYTFEGGKTIRTDTLILRLSVVLYYLYFIFQFNLSAPAFDIGCEYKITRISLILILISTFSLLKLLK